MSLNFKQVRIVVVRDLAMAPRNVGVILASSFYAIFWGLALKGFHDGLAEKVENDVIAGWTFNWFFDDVSREQLLQAPSANLFLYALFALLTTHLFVIAMASDQTASDIGNRYFRYLATRCGRTELYLGRMLSVVCFTLIAIALAGVASLISAGLIEGETTGESIAFIIETLLWLILVSLPFIALGAMMSAWTGSIGISMMTSFAVAFLVPKVFNYVELAWRKVDGIESLRSYFPSGGVKAILADNATVATILVPLLYTLLFAWIGCQIFKRREFP